MIYSILSVIYIFGFFAMISYIKLECGFEYKHHFFAVLVVSIIWPLTLIVLIIWEALSHVIDLFVKLWSKILK